MQPALSEVRNTISKLAESEPSIPEWVLTSFNDPRDPNKPGARLVKKADKVEDLK